MSKEFHFDIKAALQNGLAPDDVERNAAFMQQMKNAKPKGGAGAVAHEWVTQPLVAAVTHPFPQLMRQEQVTLLLGQTSLSTVSDTWVATPVTTYDAATPANAVAITAGGPWQLAAFTDLWLASNGSCLLFKIPSNSSGKTYVSSSVTVQSLSACHSRLFLGGLAGAHFATTRWLSVFNAWRDTRPSEVVVHENNALSTNWFLWSERAGGAGDIPFKTIVSVLGLLGNTEFDRYEQILRERFESGELGLVNSNIGVAYNALPLADHVITYGSKGIGRLVKVGSGYYEDRVTPVAVAGRCAVAGDEREHIFVEAGKDLMRVTQEDQKPQKLGFKSKISTLSATNLLVLFDPLTRDFWITDGLKCYVLADGKLGGPMDVMPTSLFRSSGTLIGTAAGIAGTHEMLLQTGTIDLGERSRKTTAALECASDGLTKRTGRVGMRYTGVDAERFTPWLPASPEGVVSVIAQFVDGSVSVKGNIDGTTHAAQVSRIRVRYNADDKRFQRGTTGRPEEG